MEASVHRRSPRIRVARPVTLLISLALVALSLVAATAGTGSASSTSELSECLGALNRVRVGAGGQGSDPNSLSAGEAAASERKSAQQRQARGITPNAMSKAPNVIIDVRWHVITKRNGTGAVSLAQIREQLAVLNDAYAGRGAAAGSANTIFRFRTKSISYTANNDWYNWSDPEVDPSDNDEAKAALHRGGFDDLNIYITGLADGLLGYATFPFDTTLTDDGIVLLNESLPGGTAAPYNEGDTATHEVGHWLGLFHTFENGCSYPGDYVGDTPYQDDGDNILSCEESLNTCPQPGRDPVHNFMSYGDDPCLDRFTRDQSQRMTLTWFTWRSDTTLLP
jgi:pregnancy-associated plasma protein-A